MAIELTTACLNTNYVDNFGIGSSGWTRTNNPSVNSPMQVIGLAGSGAGSSDETVVLPGVREKSGQRLARRYLLVRDPPSRTARDRLHTNPLLVQVVAMGATLRQDSASIRSRNRRGEMMSMPS